MRDLNPRALLQAYELSKPAPSATWVILHAANVIITRNFSLVIKKRKYFIFFVKIGCSISYLNKRWYNKLNLEVHYARNHH